MPSPLQRLRQSTIWLVSSLDSVSGIRILPQGEVMARLTTPVMRPSLSNFVTSTLLTHESVAHVKTATVLDAPNEGCGLDLG